MALQSKLFRSDQKLQSCLTQDSAHVTPGAVGDHVARIQRALNALGDVEIAAGEIAGKTYGPSTAAAVLAYKRKRNIINFSYETQADNIVGKMTIESLDKEMLRVEKPPVVANIHCRWTQRAS